MNATELRIGNWILNGNNHPIQVGYHEIRYASIHPGTQNNYEGIPLTPEILEGCGFVRNYEFEAWRLDQFDVDKWHGSWWWTVDDRGDNEGTKRRELKYLHQLQNIFFSIIGKELQANNHIIRQ